MGGAGEEWEGTHTVSSEISACKLVPIGGNEGIKCMSLGKL